MLAGIKELGLLSVDDTDHSITATDVKKAAERIADKYVDLQMPDIRETGKLRYCTLVTNPCLLICDYASACTVY